MDQKIYPQHYRQGDYSTRLGTAKSSVSIAQSGCFVTSLAMKAGFYGHTVTPPELNLLMVTKGVFIQENLLSDNALSQIYDDVKYLKTFDYEPIPTDLNNIRNLLAQPATTLTVRINLGSGNLHFVEAVACDGFSLHILNPLFGQIEDFAQHYGNPVSANLHVLVYNGPVVSTIGATPAPETTALAQRFNQTVTKSTNFDVVASYLGISNDQAIRNDAGQMVVDRIKDLSRQLQHLQEEKAAAEAVPAASVVNITIPPIPTSTHDAITPPAAPTFQDGSKPVSGKEQNSVATKPSQPISPAPQSGKVSIGEFIKALLKTLFL